jgi:phosphohistidine phosphatase
LTPRGIQRTKLLAQALEQMEISFDAVLSSPLLRAKQTAEIVVRGMQLPATLKLTESLSPSGSMEKLVREITSIRPVPDNVLLVGHEPYLSSFISLLCAGGTGLLLTLKKGGLCRLEVDRLICAQCATLEWLLPPRLLDFKPPKRKA